MNPKCERPKPRVSRNAQVVMSAVGMFACSEIVNVMVCRKTMPRYIRRARATRSNRSPGRVLRSVESTARLNMPSVEASGSTSPHTGWAVMANAPAAHQASQTAATAGVGANALRCAAAHSRKPSEAAEASAHQLVYRVGMSWTTPYVASAHWPMTAATFSYFHAAFLADRARLEPAA
ncbi:hypothetical protein GCM10023321_73320 [Pseudonocardia eucalypti]|uniref:Uncharacterized protein n=1 Tax=Pseudonocardia eucalypti TaxID=648755 RepID=A0ABP9R821_9PSEU